jgi:hypothetical protein
MLHRSSDLHADFTFVLRRFLFPGACLSTVPPRATLGKPQHGTVWVTMSGAAAAGGSVMSW